MSTNRKPGEKPRDVPNDAFKRSVAGALRAIARKPDLEVTFASEKPIPNSRQIRLRNTHARVPESDLDRVIATAPLDFNRTVCWRVLDRIVQEIAENAGNACGVSADLQIARRAHRHPD